MVKNSILLIVLMAAFNCNIQAQDIPVFSQKLTNFFLYNPAIAGHTYGSVTYSYQQSYNNIHNAPRSHYLSFHTPIRRHKFGFGLNLYQEDVNFLRNTYLSTSFAHHIRFNRSMLSLGVSGEYNMLRLNGETNSSPEDPEYQNLANGSVDEFDFSAGLVFQTTYFKMGLSGNRLATAWIKEDNLQVLSSYYTAFFQGMIPLRDGKDVLEPTITYRKFSETNNTLDLGVYYTYDNKFTGGAAWRNSQAVSLTAAVRITPKLLAGYTHEMFLGDIKNQAGSANQFTLRFDFNEYNYQQTFQDEFKSATSYRRKTLNKGNIGSRSPKQLHQRFKKMSRSSPNKRYNTTKKFPGKKYALPPRSHKIKQSKKFRN